MRAATSFCGVLFGLQAGASLGLRVSGPTKAKLNVGDLALHGIEAAEANVKSLQASLALEQQTVRQTILYMDKLSSSFGKQDSIFHGKMDQADIKMVTKFLPLFNDTKFLSAVDSCIKDMSNVMKNLPTLSAQRVKEAASKERSDVKARRKVATRFLEKESNLLSNQIGKPIDGMKAVLQAMPEEYRAYTRLGTAMLADFQNVSKTVLSNYFSSEDAFCDNTPAVIKGRTMPFVRHVSGLLPRIETFTAAQQPDVLPAMSKRVKQLVALTESMVKLFEGDAVDIITKACEVIRPSAADEQAALSGNATGTPVAAAALSEAPAAAAPAETAAPAAATPSETPAAPSQPVDPVAAATAPAEPATAAAAPAETVAEAPAAAASAPGQ